MTKHAIAGALLALALTGSAFASGAKGGLAIEAEVKAEAKADAAAGDKAFAAGDFEAAAAAYGQGFARSRDAAFVYALARTHQVLKRKDEAKALFESYLAASGDLKHRSEAEAQVGAKKSAKATGGLIGGVVDTAGGAVDAVVSVPGSVYTATKVSVASQVDASAKASAETADKAYAESKYDDARKSYDEAYAKSQQAVLLYGEGMASAQAGKAAEARAALAGYLATRPSGEQAEKARQMMLAMGGNADALAKVNVSAKVSKEVKTEAGQADAAFKAGKYADAARIYGEAHAKKADAALLYGKGMALYAQGNVTEAAEALKAYLASSGKVEFKADAQATLKACGNAQG
jgi:tetratricopeptide (TPR) repeat protein